MNLTKHIQEEPVPAVALNTAHVHGPECEDTVRAAIELGYRHIDTAPHHANEVEVGEGMGAAGLDREELFVTTRLEPADTSAKDVVRSVEESLRDMGTDYLDLALIPWPYDGVPVEEPLEALQELQDLELLLHFGIIGATPRRLARALRLAPLFASEMDFELLLGGSDLQALAEVHDLLLTTHAPGAKDSRSEAGVLQEIGEKHGKDPEQVALRWLVDQPQVIAVPASCSWASLPSSLEITDFALDSEDCARLRTMNGDGAADADDSAESAG